ncbi:MAG: hypothetical protein OHK0038_08290 [Flammeovirgaceae bacterium]
MSKEIKIGLFGFGCVGKGLYDVLQNSKGITAKIHKIVVKDRHKPRPLPREFFSYDKNDILQDSSINLVVELINDAEKAYQIVTTAMKNGKSVVSANKKMLAEHLEELVALQNEHNVSLLYEASSCGSIPIIRTLEEYYDNELLFSVSGIFNGTTNYILTKSFEEGWDYSKALAKAQELGFAESDPTLDVEGFDAKYKLILLTAHSFGVICKPEEVFNYGIRSLSSFDMQYAREKGFKIKLIAQARKVAEDKIAVYVMPTFIPSSSYIYQVDNEYNGVTVEAAFSEKQFFRGKGAGGHPTGSAVLSDISASRYDYKYEYHKLKKDFGVKAVEDVELTVYFRYLKKEQFVPEQFTDIIEKYESPRFNYVIGKARLRDLHKKDYFKQEGTFLVEMPH